MRFGLSGAVALAGVLAAGAAPAAAWQLHRPALVGHPGARPGGLSGPAQASREGYSVATSADGRTALIGSYGAGAWVFVHRGARWMQQGGRLLAPAAAGASSIGAPLRGIRLAAERVDEPGFAVALSGDGSTALIGTGIAAWVFSRHGGRWSTHGVRLFGLGQGEVSGQGTSVALSADGLTALIGAPNGGAGQPARPGLAWVFDRIPSGWSRGLQLLAYGAPRGGGYATSVALSANGHLALIGDTPAPPARSGVWVFRKVSKIWLQLATPLRGSHSAGSDVGSSVALSSNGRVALLAASGRSDATGAAGPGSLWFFRWEERRWRQQGPPIQLAHRGRSGVAISSVALARDGALAIVGGTAGGRLPGRLWTLASVGSEWRARGRSVPIPCASCAGSGGSGSDPEPVPLGPAVAVSANGSTALVGSVAQRRYRGAGWIFTR